MTLRQMRDSIARADARLNEHSKALTRATAIVLGLVLGFVAFMVAFGWQAGVLP